MPRASRNVFPPALPDQQVRVDDITHPLSDVPGTDEGWASIEALPVLGHAIARHAAIGLT